MQQKGSETNKQPYVKPQLVEFGDIGKLTQGSSATISDGTHTARK